MYGELKHNITYIIVPLSGYSFNCFSIIESDTASGDNYKHWRYCKIKKGFS